MHPTPPRAAPVRAALAAAALALSACGGGAGGLVQQPACKGADQPCGVDAECCAALCLATGACAQSSLGEPCGSSADCAIGVCQAGRCAAGLRPLGDVCDADGQCQSQSCDLTGHCAAPCVSQGGACGSSAQCCDWLGCATGTCQASCGWEYDACASDLQCCSNFTCRAGQCQAGACGTSGDRCASDADCCAAAQVGKDYHCSSASGLGFCELGYPGRTPPDACATDADCAGTYPCRGGYCHYADGAQRDGWWCLDGRECAGGTCTSTQAGVPGTCCSGAGAGCTAGGGTTLCCDPYACTGPTGAQRCGTCLDFTNSGPQGDESSQCTSASQCCENRHLTCTLGECCTIRGYPCTPGSGGTECCALDTCGTVTTWAGTTTQCCGDYGSSCGAYGACCDGFICAGSVTGSCLKGPGQPCDGSGQCAESEGVACNTATGKCCIHGGSIFVDCATDDDCCSGVCNPSTHSCDPAPEYGKCLDDGDCWGPDYNQDWSGPVCGGSAALGPQVCCPVPGDTCLQQADCCDAGNVCKVPYDGSSASALCCNESTGACSQNNECCTGSCEVAWTGVAWVGTCCAYPWLAGFTCATNADCCSNSRTGYIGSRCDTGRCCWEAGHQVGEGNGALCCSGREHFGACQ